MAGPVDESEATVEVRPQGPTRLDRRILTLLLAGLTDLTAPTQLGLSPRTLHRRLRHLMDVAGVRTRIQLGAHTTRTAGRSPCEGPSWHCFKRGR